ncbi:MULTISPECIES: hypothetical protein [Cytobacillus]|uniref:hypothetical protein n=1 Tax=Cytobacillus TaxID=2675230 RepID=UPI002041C455|nr:hypothetical protein [Cytobacillus kochii]MCM3324011.1 hypothetical protein [Cytobacillus kochii]MCM3346407.1 hypothetical protein [Cytobacillus kochii]MDM5205719.1 hypothetical protein [Cytobacillus kochii]
MKKVFEVNHQGDHILVENYWINGEKLYVNGELQDENLGLAIRGDLEGKLEDSSRIKVTIGGFLTINCKIFLENRLIFSSI